LLCSLEGDKPGSERSRLAIIGAVPVCADQHAATTTTTTTTPAISAACPALQLQPAELQQAPVLHEVQLLRSFW
jgi:hypothetical protein